MIRSPVPATEPSPIEGPQLAAGFWTWRGRAAGARVLFLGRFAGGREAPTVRPGLSPAEERAACQFLAGATCSDQAWLEQVHSADVLEAVAGCCGPGDGLVARRPGLALSIVTADCVPVLLSTGRSVAAVHAGWRGIAAGIVSRAVEHLTGERDRRGAAEPPPESWCAWVGPAIGACCYEVGSEVAEQVVAASTPSARVDGPHGRPHLDLPAAAVAQLGAAGVGTVRPLLWCTRCEGRHLHSYRREGPGGGRNRALIWLPAAAATSS